MENVEKDDFKLEGQILFKIEKLSEFAQAPNETERQSDVVLVRGLPWRILVMNSELFGEARYLSYYLQCNADNPDPGWFCAAKANLKILSQSEGKKDHVRTIKHVYNAKCNTGDIISLTFEELMAPERGLYDAQSDTIVLAADIFLPPIRNHKEQINFSNAKPNASIKVENEYIEVNKFVLNLSSAYFDRYFFDDSAADNIELPPMTTVEEFKRMLATLPPKHLQLDDGCIEAVLILAERFSMDNVLELCRNFLRNESCKTKLFKFRMAHKYGWKEMKEAILHSMTLDDFQKENCMKNAEEFGLLDDDAKTAHSARHAELVDRQLNPVKK